MTKQQDVFLTDLPRRVEGGFKPARGVGKGWVAVDFEAGEIHGSGVAAGYNSDAPELTIRLDLQGTYVLYLALGCYDGIRAWLDGEQGFREFLCGHGGHQLQEVRLHAADLTGRCLHVAPIPSLPHQHDDSHCFLAYIRAVPKDHAPQRSARNLVATNDGYSWIALDGMATVRDVTKQFQPYRDSDFGRMLWCPCGADFSGNHLSRVGTTTPFNTTHAYRRCDALFAQTTKRIIKGGGDILKTAVAAARDVGIEIQFYIRPEAFFAPFPYEHVFTSKFLTRHPRWRCRDEFGREVMRMSYAYPEVQEHMLAYIDELLAYQPHGICFAFNRSLPMMICEKPVLQAFQKRWGRAPRLPDEVDAPEMLAVRHELLGGFIQSLHDRLAARQMSFSCIVDMDEAANRVMGLDVETLIARGLTESVYVTGYCPHSAFWKKMRDLKQARIFSSIHYSHSEGPTAPNPFDHQWQAESLKRILDEGFAGMFYWDAETMHRNPYNWHVLRHGGTPAFLDRVLAGDPAVAPVLRKLTAVRGVRQDRYYPMRSY